MSTTMRYTTRLVTVAAALSLWTALIAAADSTVGGLPSRELTDTGDCASLGHSGDAAPEIPYTPRQSYLDTLREV